MNQQDKKEQANQQSAIEDLTVDEAQGSEVKGSVGRLNTYEWQHNVKA